jgi:hypothetical protein
MMEVGCGSTGGSQSTTMGYTAGVIAKLQYALPHGVLLDSRCSNMVVMQACCSGIRAQTPKIDGISHDRVASILQNSLLSGIALVFSQRMLSISVKAVGARI